MRHIYTYIHTHTHTNSSVPHIDRRYVRLHIRPYEHPRTYRLHLVDIKSTYLNELYRDRRFSDTARANDDELVCLRVAWLVTELRHFSYDRRKV